MIGIGTAIGRTLSLIDLANEQAVKEGREYYCQGCVDDKQCDEIPMHWECCRRAPQPAGEGEAGR